MNGPFATVWQRRARIRKSLKDPKGFEEATAAVLKAHDDFARNLVSMDVLGTGLDPFLFSILMGCVLSQASPEDTDAMRKWSLAEWAPAVRGYLKDAAKAPLVPSSQAASPTAPVPSSPPVLSPTQATAPSSPTVPMQLPPRPPPPPVPPAAGGGGADDPNWPKPSGGPPIPAPPLGVSQTVREAWIQARTRAGEYCRGLGNYAAEKTGEIVREVWAGEDIVVSVDEEERQRVLQILRQKTAQAIEEQRSEDWLASEMGNATGDWARNWGRIARTELQGAHNDGVLIEAYRTYGDDARVARVPNADACKSCREAYLDDDGKPRIFGLEELLANGTNVGKPAGALQPTLWPLHPNCSCGTQAVPPGLRYAADWTLERDN